jgi:hypothetical protein
VREELETAFAVVYARTFTQSNARLSLLKAGLPDDPADRALHYEIIDLRNGVYAHNDGTKRKVIGVGREKGNWNWTAHTYGRLEPDWLAEVIPMLERQGDRFTREADALERQHGDRLTRKLDALMQQRRQT